MKGDITFATPPKIPKYCHTLPLGAFNDGTIPTPKKEGYTGKSISTISHIP